MNLLLSPPPRLVFTLLLCSGLALLGIQLSQLRSSDSQAESDASIAQANLFRLTSALATHQQQTLADINQRLRVLGGLSLATVFDSRACNRLLARQLDTMPSIENLIILDSSGKLRCYAKPLDELRPQDIFNSSNLLTGQRSQLPRTQGDKVLLAAPLLNPAAQAEGLVIAIAPLAGWLRASPTEISADISLTLLDAEGRILITEEPDASILKTLPARHEAGVTTGQGSAGKEYWQAAAPLNGPRGLMLLARQEAPKTLWELTYAMLGLAGLGLFILATIAVLHLTNTWRNPLWRELKIECSRNAARYFQWLRNTIASFNRQLKTLPLLRRSNADLKRALVAQKTRAYQLQRLDQLNQLLLRSASLREAAIAVSHCVQALLPNCGGALLLRTRPGVMETAVSWGEGAQREFSRPQDCWAQRLGRTYIVSEPSAAAYCTHLESPPAAPYLCVPLITQGAFLGTLHIQAPATSIEAPPTWLAELLAQRVADAISRIQRETLLRAQATRDSLTGLHNRRFLEETFALEESCAKRSGAPIGLMLLDIDHFKQFNDRFGHDAGDALLRALGGTIHSQVRKGDVACRFGGEEFVIVLPGADLDITVTRAEALRLAVRDLQVVHGEQALGPITVSIGVACYPRHGANCHSVLKVADQALYACKSAGRDRVMRPAPMLVSSI